MPGTGSEPLPTLGRTWKLVERTVAEFFGDRCPQLAAAMSYYALFSLFPLVIVSVAAFGVIVGQEEAQRRVIELLADAVPVMDGSRAELERAVGGVAGHAGTFGLVGFAGLLFSASGLVGAIRNALNTAWDVEDRRPPVRGKLVDIALLAGVGPLLAGSLAITLAGQVGPNWITGAAVLERVVAIVLAGMVFAVLYKVLPATSIPLRDVWPGALVAAVGYEVVKSGFTLYVANFGGYSDVYGSVAAVVVFLFFVFLASNVLLLGAEVASEWPRVRDGYYDHPDRDGEPFGQQVRDLLRSLVVRVDR